MVKCCNTKENGFANRRTSNRKSHDNQASTHPKPCDVVRYQYKKIRTHEGWTFKWTVPQQALIKSIIPGPFLRPKLAYALPYIVMSDCKNCISKSTRELRNGIPDPWLEYLAWKENRSPKNARSSWDYVWLTDMVWNNRRLPMLQGIPDPWRDDFDCTGNQDVLQSEKTKKKPKRISARKASAELSKALPKRDSKGKASCSPEEKIEAKKNKRTTYETVKDNMIELKDELRLRDAEMSRIADSAKKTYPTREIPREKPIKKTSKDTTGKVRVSFDRYENQIHKCQDDISQIKRDAQLVQQKIQKLKEQQEKRQCRRSKNATRCAGNCGRFVRPSDGKIEETVDTSASVASAKDFLKVINDRIQITKNALNAVDNNAIIPEKRRSSMDKHERSSACDSLGKTIIDSQLQQSSLFTRSGTITIDRIPDEMPDHVDTCVQHCCERQTSSRQIRRNRENEVLIVEPFSEQD